MSNKLARSESGPVKARWRELTITTSESALERVPYQALTDRVLINDKNKGGTAIIRPFSRTIFFIFRRNYYDYQTTRWAGKSIRFKHEFV